MRDNPKPFEIFKHFKGKQYQILALAKDAGNGRDMVVYQALYGDYMIYVRDLAEFMSPVSKNEYPDTLQEYRFERQSQGAAEAEEEREIQRKTEQNTRQDEAKEPEQSIAQGTAKEAEQSTAQGQAKEPEQSVSQDTVREAERKEGDFAGGFLDPMVEEFLDAGTIYEKLNILAGLRHRITEDMLEIMAVASDIELNEGSIQEKYTELRNCLLMTEKYERKRLK